MKRQMATLIHEGVYKVIYDDSVAFNPYRIIYKTRDMQGNKQQKQVKRYADMTSCMIYLAEVTRG